MSTQKKYKKREEIVEKSGENEMRITTKGTISNFISYAGKTLTEKNEPRITIKASGNAITKACTVSNVLVHKIKGLAQICSISNTSFTEVYDPLEEGLDIVTISKNLAVFEILLVHDSKATPEEKKNPSYQSPLPDDQLYEESGFDAKPRQRKPRNTSQKQKPQEKEKQSRDKKPRSKAKKSHEEEEKKTNKPGRPRNAPKEKNPENKGKKGNQEKKAPNEEVKKETNPKTQKPKNKRGNGNRPEVGYVPKKSE